MSTPLSGPRLPPRRPSRAAGRRPLRLAGLALLGLAVVKELRKPAAERSWRGELFGCVPYDLRRPTLARLRATVWQPDSERWFVPRVMGVGWSPNLARIVAALRGARR